MSAINNSAGTEVGLIGSTYGWNDDSIQPAEYRKTLPYSYEASDREADVMWPRSRRVGADYANIAPIWDNMPNRWEWCWPPTGQRTPKKITGITKDSSGNPTGGVTVLLFNTAANLFVDTVVSASDGSYQTSDPNNVTCFEVGYLSGSPDTTGATKNNLAGV